MPRDATNLWTFVAELDHDSRMAMFAHCVALTVNAVKLPEAVSLDMTGYWRPTARTYLGRITKASPCGRPSAMKRPVGWRK